MPRKEAGWRSRGVGTLPHEASLGQKPAGRGPGNQKTQHPKGLRSKPWAAWRDPEMKRRQESKAEAQKAVSLQHLETSLSTQLFRGFYRAGVNPAHRSPPPGRTATG